MPKYWITYTITGSDGNLWATTPIASCEVTTDSPPATEGEVFKLADGITDAQRSRGRIPADAHVSIISWSRMDG